MGLAGDSFRGVLTRTMGRLPSRTYNLVTKAIRNNSGRVGGICLLAGVSRSGRRFSLSPGRRLRTVGSVEGGKFIPLNG